ncbi:MULTISPECIES: hypothetical protein [unclassified Methylophaga]|jgi:hypothetical protein|uniref:hypothetical protein n=1 Tax=unclassified Methylophaga TaxID=2629249 RepID=UPI00259D235D|nr:MULTISPECIES: hypothetical protein [unclassified Methylophaga]|tara:strand:+ start:23227 stop:23721 length:495 start_codon:yes stop_codon:yes gene_type:complete
MNWLIIAVFAASCSASFFVGYDYRDRGVQAEMAKAISKALEDADEQYEKDRQQELELIEKQKKTEIVYKTITKEVPKYVPVIQQKDSDCNLSNGTVRLFNSAARDDMPETTDIDADTDTRPSTVTEAELIDYGLGTVNQYNKAKNQCNALIDWWNSVNNKEQSE